MAATERSGNVIRLSTGGSVTTPIVVGLVVYNAPAGNAAALTDRATGVSVFNGRIGAGATNGWLLSKGLRFSQGLSAGPSVNAADERWYLYLR